jgi:hypothetical protein
MKKFIITLLITASCLSNNSFAQTVVSGVKVPNKLGFAGSVRYLNGAGYREKYFMRVYVAALYMKDKNTNPKTIINADKPMSIRLQIISSMLTIETMVRYIREGFERSLNGKTEHLQTEIDLICDVFSSEPTKVGDVYDIHYTPGIGITCSKNGKPYTFSVVYAKINNKSKNLIKDPKMAQKVKSLKKTSDGFEALPGIDLKKGIFGIWLSNDPVDEALKDAMLGINKQ